MHMSDKIIRAIARDAGIQITVAQTHDIVERARQIHKTLPVATAALGRTLTAASIIGDQLKSEDGSVTIQVKGNGILGSIIAVSDNKGNVRGYLQNPAADLPLREDGKLAVGTAVGAGYLMVIKDVGMKEPITGTVALVSGEIAEDITRYFAESEQIPSACALGVLVDTDQSVRQAGGYLVQLMPNVTDEEIARLEQGIAAAGSITTMLEQGNTPEEIARRVLSGFDVEILGQEPIAYQCNCGTEKVSRALISMGREELQNLITEEEKIEITCQFCDKIYHFSREQLQELLNSAAKKT